jgi:tRNA-2-methylthio-N6-dimethylallyladenosine synthase
VQSGSDAVLEAMNRRGTADDYRRVVDCLRRARPDLALSSDFIVGFPGETDADFAQTLRLVEDVGYAQAFSFKYSRRPGTPAAIMRKQVAEAVKTERLAALQDLLNTQQRAFNDACIGRTLAVLVERDGRKPGQRLGKSPYLQAVHFEAGPEVIGREVRVRIEAAHPHSLAGRPAEPLPMGAVA